MMTLDDVRRIALALPEMFERPDGHRGGATWRTKRGLVVWERGPSKTDLAQLEELGREWPAGTVVALHLDGTGTAEALLNGFPETFFTIPHLDGYPAVLARLDTADPGLLEELIADAWLARVPQRIARDWLGEHTDGGKGAT